MFLTDVTLYVLHYFPHYLYIMKKNNTKSYVITNGQFLLVWIGFGICFAETYIISFAVVAHLFP